MIPASQLSNPYLQISKKYGVDYSLVLFAADYYTHGCRAADNVAAVAAIKIGYNELVLGDIQETARLFTRAQTEGVNWDA